MLYLSQLLFLLGVWMLASLASSNDDMYLQDIRCPLESHSISLKTCANVGVRTLRLWPAVLKLLTLGLGALFRDKDFQKARRLLADVLDLSQGKLDFGMSETVMGETRELLHTMGFPSVQTCPRGMNIPINQGLARAFQECPLALSATYRVLALAHMLDTNARESPSSWAQAMAVAQRFHQLGSGSLMSLFSQGTFQRDPAYLDLSSWPITGEEWETEKRSLAHSLRDLGGATSVARTDVAKSLRISDLSIALVTVCAYPEGSLLPRFAASIHRTYAQRHGYSYIHHRDEDGRLSAGRPKAWAKVRALHDALEDNRWDWVLWIDCDIYFMDLATTLDSLLFRYASRESNGAASSRKGGLDEDVRLVATEDAQSLNTAIFLLRRCDWSKQLLRRVWGMEEKALASFSLTDEDWTKASSPFLGHPWWEQPAFTQHLLGENHRRYQEMLYPQVVPSSSSPLVPYPPQVKLMPQKEMNSYHPISSRLEGETWAPGKFVLSFNGVRSVSGELTAQVLYANYYEVFCALNGLREACAADTISFFGQSCNAIAHDSSSGHREVNSAEAVMFAPWLCNNTLLVKGVNPSS